jgi:hypothetical protein
LHFSEKANIKDKIGIRKSKIYIQGLSCFYHDSAACLIGNGRILSVAQKEWFTRKKHDPGLTRRLFLH